MKLGSTRTISLGAAISPFEHSSPGNTARLSRCEGTDLQFDAANPDVQDANYPFSSHIVRRMTLWQAT